MGGKHKQAQRIKNNARPSSSGRSAELLASSSHAPQTIKEIRFVPPTLSLMKTEEFDSSVSPAFQIVFKKMNKKDCTTKIKEFSDLIAGSEAEAIKTILAFWATLYSILATDTDHRVREAVHNAHHQIILKDKKIIAPFLKQLIGPWFTSQYDNYPPAASAAAKAFTAAFPPNKVQDCVMYCQREILTYLHDNLTSKIDTGAKHGTNEDSEAKYERIIISTLQGYCLYLNTLSDEQIGKSTELNKQIVSNSRFLKLAAHKSAIIRATWFRVLATLYHKAFFLLDDDQGHVVPVVFSNLDESEPSVVGFVWEAALLIMDLGQEWWKFINVEKHYIAKLRKVLKEGGQGSAAVIYPNLLSLLHKLPPSLRTDQFYDSFFDNLRTGLKRKTVTSSKSESTAIVTALVECLQYVILINNKNVDLCEKLIKSQLLPLVEWGLGGDQACYRTIFHQVTLTIQYWSKNKTLENYPRYLNLFWDGLRLLFENSTHEHDVAERHTIFMQLLKTTAKPKEQLKVKFSTSDGVNQAPAPVAPQVDEEYNDGLRRTVYAILKSYVTQIQQKQTTVLLTHLFALVHLFESRQFLLGLSELLTDGANGKLSDIYTRLLYDWLKTPDLSCETVVELAFVVAKYVEADEKNFILNSFLEFSETAAFNWCIKTAFSHPYNQDRTVQNWLKNDKIATFLVATTERNLSGDCPADLRTLFKLALTENDNGELLLDKTTIAQIIQKLRVPLHQPQDFQSSIDTCVRMASHVAHILYTGNALPKCGHDLLLSLFRFSCVDHSDIENLTEDSRWEVATTWQDSLALLAKNLQKADFGELISKFADSIEEIFLETDANRLIETIVSLIRSVFQGQPLMVGDIYRLIFNRQFVPAWKNKLTELCLRGEYLSGRLTAEFATSAGEENVFKYFVWISIKVAVLESPLQDGDEDDVTDIAYVIEDNTREMTDVLYDLTACQSFLSTYKMTKHFTDIGRYYVLIKNKTQSILDKLQIHEQIKTALCEQLNSDQWLWCCVTDVFRKDSPRNVYAYYTKQVTNELSKLNLCQIYGSNLDFDDVRLTSAVFDDAIILRNLAHCDEIDVQIAQVFDGIKQLRSSDIPKFLFENKDLSWRESQTIIETVRLFSTLIAEKFHCLSRQHWDFGVISLAAWASSCCKLRASYEQAQMQALMVAVVDFYVNVNEKMAQLRTENAKNSFAEEWDDFFLPNVQADLMHLWMYLSEQFIAKPSLSIEFHPFLQSFGRVADHFNYKLIFTKDNSTPSWSKVLKRCASLLVNSSAVLQLWGYKMLMVLVPGLIEIDLQSDLSSIPNVKGFTCEQFKEVLARAHSIVEDALTGFKLGEDSCQVTPFTDSYTYVFGYLLLWSVLLNLCEKSPPELRYQYADWLRSNDYLKSLLNNIFKLMPTEILHYNEGKSKGYLKLFAQQPSLTFQEPCTSEQIEHIVCWIYTLSLSQLPALVRQWWSETETKVTQIVEKVTALYVSPQLCSQELQDVARHENKFKNMTVKTVLSVREVIAIYTVDEAQMELVISLPQNYPLGGPDVRCNRQIGGTLHKQWLMQLKKYLLHQNGRVWDGLSLWNSSLDKKFDGVEECYICFAVLHPGTYQLPKLTCQTCKKKFHSACLYKWFSTSNKSSCPICRNLF